MRAPDAIDLLADFPARVFDGQIEFFHAPLRGSPIISGDRVTSITGAGASITEIDLGGSRRAEVLLERTNDRFSFRDLKRDGNLIVFTAKDSQRRDGVYSLDSVAAPKVIADVHTPLPIAATAVNANAQALSQNLVVFSTESGLFASSGDGRVVTLADVDTAVASTSGRLTSWSSATFDGTTYAFIGSTADSAGVYVGQSEDSLRLVADKTTPVPSGGGTFSQFYSLASSDGNVSFLGESSQVQGIYTSDGTELTVVVDSRTEIPEGTGTFTEFAPTFSQDGKTTAFLGGVDQQKGIYVNVGEAIYKVVNLTDELEHGSTAGDRQVSSPRDLFLSADALQGGRLVFGAEFDDGTWAIYIAELNSVLGYPLNAGVSELRLANGKLEALDFGSKPLPAEIHGRVFQDIDSDGAQDEVESGIASWTIFLDQNNDRVLNQSERFTHSDEDGNYFFDGLQPFDTHNVAIVIPPDSTNIQTFPVEPSFHAVVPGAGETVRRVDFGLGEADVEGANDGSISGRLFRDLDGDGARDANEEWLDGWFVSLHEVDDETGQERTTRPARLTDANGAYSFTGTCRGAIVRRARRAP